MQSCTELRHLVVLDPGMLVVNNVGMLVRLHCVDLAQHAQQPRPVVAYRTLMDRQVYYKVSACFAQAAGFVRGPYQQGPS